MALFMHRHDAGRALARKLQDRHGEPKLLVLALPRGGVPVAYEVAVALAAPLDIFLVRKLGFPGHEELAMGAIASGGVMVVNERLRDMITPEMLQRAAMQEQAELERREELYRQGRPPHAVEGRNLILIDDGLATGATMRAAVEALGRMGAESITVAVPVAAQETCEEFQDLVDSVVCAATPRPFRSVGSWYRDFTQTTDDEVRSLLEQARLRAVSMPEPARRA